MLVWRRAANARSLLAAAAAAAVIATCLLAGLAEYNRAVVRSGGQAAVAAAPPDERSVLVRGPAGDSTAWTTKDQAVRAEFGQGLGGARTTIAVAGIASGRQFVGPTGTAAPDSNGLVFARVMFADQLADHGRLVEGAWPVAGATPAQTAVGEAAARQLGLTVGARIPINDRQLDKVTEVVISGIFAAEQPNDPYWLMMPELAEGAAPGSTTYGPLVLDRADYFAGGWASSGSAAWVVEPQLADVDLDGLLAVRQSTRSLSQDLPDKLGFGSSGQVITHLDRLVDRLQRADLVGRSALLTPLLLIVVLGGYALMLLASLLTEQRVAETALLRARGAARHQLAGLATQEAMLVALPAALLAPPLVGLALGQLHRIPVVAEAGLRLDQTTTMLTWAVGLLAAMGCVLAMVLPALRGGSTYVADLAARSRPTRAGIAQRAGVDLALVGFAVLAWFQLRQYQSPLAGTGGVLGIDPMLASAAPIGVLAGSVLALRLLPPLTRLAERLVDRRAWFATQLGTWQAGRRPHAGPVLLLALAVAISTLAWTLAATTQRSVTDRSDHLAGTDLRLTEASSAAPSRRSDELVKLPGVTRVLPGLRSTISLGENSVTATVIGFDSATMVDSWRLRSDLGDASTLLSAMAEHRPSATNVPLPAGTVKLDGTLRFAVPGNGDGNSQSTASAVLVDAHGGAYRIELGRRFAQDPELDFTITLPAGTGQLALAGFEFNGNAPLGSTVRWTVSKLATIGAGDQRTDLAVERPWQSFSAIGTEAALSGSGSTITADYMVREQLGYYGASFNFMLIQPASKASIPALASTEALSLLRKAVGDEVQISLGGGPVMLKIYGTVSALPGVETGPAILVDLPAATQEVLHTYARALATQEWWLTTDPQRHQAASAAADGLGGVLLTDRVRLAEQAGTDPYGVGARIALFIAAIGAIALALVGVAVDVRATSRRRVAELAVLHTLGATPRLLARALIVEQAFLAGLGVLVGLVVGIGVAATMAPLVILTPTADRPIPVPLLHLDWPPVLGLAAGLLALAMLLAGLVATSLRQRLAAAQLRIGADR